MSSAWAHYEAEHSLSSVMVKMPKAPVLKPRAHPVEPIPALSLPPRASINDIVLTYLESLESVEEIEACPKMSRS